MLDGQPSKQLSAIVEVWRFRSTNIEGFTVSKQESPADAVKPTRRSMQKLLKFDVFRFISPNSISLNFKLPKMHSGGAAYVFWHSVAR